MSISTSSASRAIVSIAAAGQVCASARITATMQAHDAVRRWIEKACTMFPLDVAARGLTRIPLKHKETAEYPLAAAFAVDTLLLTFTR